MRGKREDRSRRWEGSRAKVAVVSVVRENHR